MAKIRHRRFGFARVRVVVIALGISIFGFAVPASQASGATRYGEGDVIASSTTSEFGRHIVQGQVINLCEWEPMSCERECMIEPWLCGGGELCWLEPWYCFEEPVTVNVKMDGSGSGVVTSSPVGINCGLKCSGKFPEGSTVTLTAKAGEGSKFTGWSGGATSVSSGCSGTGACKMTLAFIRLAVYPPLPLPPVSVTATFDLKSPSLGLTVFQMGAGSGTVSSSPVGIDCGGTCTAEFEEGKEVTLSANAEAGSVFSGWSGAGCSGTDTCKVTMTEAKSVTANFSLEQHLLAVTREGSGAGAVTSEPAGIACGSECSASYEPGAVVTLAASADPGSEFGGWTGCDSETEGKCVVTMGADATVKAKFDEAKTLSVQKAGAGLGSVKSSPGGLNCVPACDLAKLKFPSGTPDKEVTLTATPYKGSAFVAWGGDCAGNALTCKVTLSAAKSVTAEFASIPEVSLALNKISGSGTVKNFPPSVNCPATCSTQTLGFYEGSEVTLTAIPYKSTFVQWTGACSGSSPTCKVTMDEAETVGAEFTGALPGSVPLTLKKTVGSTGTGKVQASYAGGINCDASCTANTATFKPGAKVLLKEGPSKGSAFVEWGGACSGPGSCEVTLSEAKEVTAEFEAIPVDSLTLRKAGGGRGAVRGKPVGINCGLTCPQTVALYPWTASVTLTAIPANGSGPVQWVGCDEVTGSGLCIVTMNSAKEVTAKFE